MRTCVLILFEELLSGFHYDANCGKLLMSPTGEYPVEATRNNKTITYTKMSEAEYKAAKYIPLDKFQSFIHECVQVKSSFDSCVLADASTPSLPCLTMTNTDYRC